VTLSVALAPGDGVGPAVVDATARVLAAVTDARGIDLATESFNLGAERLLDEGAVMAPGTMDRLRRHDAILLGAVGHPEADDAAVAKAGHHRIRREFDLWCNRRPARLLAGDLSPLTGYEAGEIDLLWVRENGEGEYVDAGGRLERGGATEVATQTAIYTRRGVERVVRYAFEAAAEREGYLTSVTKSNVLSHGSAFWDETVEAVAAEFPGVTVEHAHVDAANLRVVSAPESFDVVVAPNLFSDILTDATAGVVGGLGVAPSANVAPDGDVPGMYEPVHGTAPDIAGQGVANPLATVLSAAMLLEDTDHPGAAADVRAAVRAQARASSAPRTPDLGGTVGTDAVAADLVARVRTEPEG
jgi:tartrate dehydrogenase/decarboxylase/D-malate dehydrogenase